MRRDEDELQVAGRTDAGNGSRASIVKEAPIPSQLSEEKEKGKGKWLGKLEQITKKNCAVKILGPSNSAQ